MTRKTLRRSLLVFAPLALLLVLGTQAEAIYLFYMRKDLAHVVQKTPQKVVGKQVVFTDELIILWPETVKALKAYEGDKRKNEIDGEEHVLFATTHFKCAIPQSKMGTYLTDIYNDAKQGYAQVTQKIEDVNRRATKDPKAGDYLSPAEATKERKKLYWELYRIWKNKPIVTVYGTVKRADLWGAVDDEAKSAGVSTESITIVVDKVEKPRKRWYKSLDE